MQFGGENSGFIIYNLYARCLASQGNIFSFNIQNVIQSKFMRANNQLNLATKQPINYRVHPKQNILTQKCRQSVSGSKSSKFNKRTSDRNLKTEAEQPREEYFNRQKIQVQAKNAIRSNQDYGIFKSKERLKLNKNSKATQHKQTNQKLLNKLKFIMPLPRGLIGFDGTVLPAKTAASRKSMSGSKYFQQPSQMPHHHSLTSRMIVKKSKAKSKNKNAKAKLQTTARVCKPVIKSQSNHEQNNHLNSTKVHTQVSIQTELSSPSHPQFHPFTIELLQFALSGPPTSLIPSLLHLKKITTSVREDYLCFLSKVSHEIGITNSIFFQSVQLTDRYLNEQIVINKHKNIALASLLLAIKLDDRSQSHWLNESTLCDFEESLEMMECNESIYNSPQSSKKINERIEQENTLVKINEILRSVNFILKEELPYIPTAEEILELELSILVKEDFKLRLDGLSFFIESITCAWDNSVTNSLICLPSIPVSKLILSIDQNLVILVQVIHFAVHNIEIYSYPTAYIVFAAVFLLLRTLADIHIERADKNAGYDKYRLALKKNTNLLFVDSSGINAAFGSFLDMFGIQIGDILPCCRIVSSGFRSQILAIACKQRARQSNKHYNFNIKQVYPSEESKPTQHA